MTDYRKTPNEKPCARHLEPGDILSADQGACVQAHVLARYGYCTAPLGGTWAKPAGYRVIRLSERKVIR